MNDAVHSAVERGHRELAGKLVAEGFKHGGYGFNVLHQNVSSILTWRFGFEILHQNVRLQVYSGIWLYHKTVLF